MTTLLDSLPGLLEQSAREKNAELSANACDSIHNILDNGLAPEGSCLRSLVLCAESAVEVNIGSSRQLGGVDRGQRGLERVTNSFGSAVAQAGELHTAKRCLDTYSTYSRERWAEGAVARRRTPAD